MTNTFRSITRATIVGITAAALAFTVAPPAVAAPPDGGSGTGAPQLEQLDRGLVAAQTGTGVFLSWRLLVGEAYGSGATGLTGADFVVYRDGQPLATVTDSTNYLDAVGTATSQYQVAKVVAGRESAPSDAVAPLAENHLDIPLQRPADGVTPAGEAFTYAAGDVSVGDVDGDGQYEYVVKWDPSNSKDVSQVGYTGTVYVDTYELDGTLLNRIDLGVNIRAGAHYTQFLVYDFDGDGKSETILKTAPGTKSVTYAADGSVADEGFITMPAEDVAAGFGHADDYRMSAADFADHLTETFQGWSTRSEVTSGQWPATIEEALGVPVTHSYPLSQTDARELVDYFIDVYAPSRSANNKLRNFAGFILDGPEYLTVFDGATGAELETVRYEPGRGDDGLLWGDYAMGRIEPGNRVDRFLSGVAYLDGERPSAVFARGYYTRSTIATYDWDGSHLTPRWSIDSGHVPLTNPFNDGPHGRDGTDPVYGSITTQGFHSLSAADVDGDGKHEIVYGSATIDDDGGLLYSSTDVMPEGSATPGVDTRLGHGDAMHVTDIDPARPGLEIFTVHEGGAYAPYGTAMRDAATGEVIFGAYSGRDTGRGMIGDVRADVPGIETWSSMPGGTDASGLLSAQGDILSASTPGTNQSIRWSADLTTQLVNGSGTADATIDDWTRGRVLDATGTRTNNGTKGNPGLVADVLGDWREELVVRTADSSALRLFTSTEVTTHKLYTLMHDPQYRAEVARQQTTYNQPSYTGFYLASDMSFADVPLRAAPQPVAKPGIGVATAGVNVTWQAPAVEGTSAITGYRVTLTPASGESRTQDVGAAARSTTFAGVPAGTWTATVVARNAQGASDPSDASAGAVVTGKQPVPLGVNAKSQCVNGTAHVAVYAYNSSGKAADIRLSVRGVDKKQSAVAPAAAVYNLVPSGQTSVAAGAASVTAYSFADGVGYHSTYSLPYAAITCG
ncbi:fibronectin type III domain-containing protein [Microbacterium sp. P02]|uniref:rhamnogalacturonan lyase family protein n=1 Tax=Microbacterium sp. P02 TaxID=3366260 RepID=UPI0036705ED6